MKSHVSTACQDLTLTLREDQKWSTARRAPLATTPTRTGYPNARRAHVDFITRAKIWRTLGRASDVASKIRRIDGKSGDASPAIQESAERYVLGFLS